MLVGGSGVDGCGESTLMGWWKLGLQGVNYYGLPAASPSCPMALLVSTIYCVPLSFQWRSAGHTCGHNQRIRYMCPLDHAHGPDAKHSLPTVPLKALGRMQSLTYPKPYEFPLFSHSKHTAIASVLS
jgi:hypothetical protein